MKQGDKLKAKKTFRYKGNDGSTMLVKAENRFRIVTDARFHQQKQGHCLIRSGRGKLTPQWFFTNAQLEQYFEVVGND